MFVVIQFDVEDLHHVVGLGPVEAVVLLDAERALHDVRRIAAVGGELVAVPHRERPLLVPGEVAALQVAQVLRVLGNDLVLLQLADAETNILNC